MSSLQQLHYHAHPFTKKTLCVICDFDTAIITTVTILIIVVLVIMVVYRLRKKDEGSYLLEPHRRRWEKGYREALNGEFDV